MKVVILFIGFLTLCSCSYHVDEGSLIMFTSNQHSVSVCNPDNRAVCEQGVPCIFLTEHLPIIKMELGLLNSTTLDSSLEYNASKFGIPIFHLRAQPISSKLSIEFVIAKGTRKDANNWDYYYVHFESNETISLPADVDYLQGSLYFNQRYARYAYYVIRGPEKIYIYSFKFEDMLQGDYGSRTSVKIKPLKVTTIKQKVANYRSPYFTIDPILGAMVHLSVKNEDEFKFIYHKIDENKLSNFEEVPGYSSKPQKAFNYLTPKLDNLEYLPSFISYGKNVLLYVHKQLEMFSPNQSEPFGKSDKKNIAQRRLYGFLPLLVEFGEPLGKYTPIPATSPSESPILVQPPKELPTCEPSFLESTPGSIALISAFGVLDGLLFLAFIALVVLYIKGRHLYKNFNNNDDTNDGSMTGDATTSNPRVLRSPNTTTTVTGGGGTTTDGGGNVTYDQTTGKIPTNASATAITGNSIPTKHPTMNPGGPATPTHMTKLGNQQTAATMVPQSTVLKTFE